MGGDLLHNHITKHCVTQSDCRLLDEGVSLHKYICQPLSALVSVSQPRSLPGHIPFIIDEDRGPCLRHGRSQYGALIWGTVVNHNIQIYIRFFLEVGLQDLCKNVVIHLNKTFFNCGLRDRTFSPFDL